MAAVAMDTMVLRYWIYLHIPNLQFHTFFEIRRSYGWNMQNMSKNQLFGFRI